MRCLVTGADGFLGANLVQHLQRAGHEVTGMALNRKGATSLDALNVKCRVEYGDITDRQYCERVVNATEPQWLFHLAAVSIVKHAAADPQRCYLTNIIGTANILQACERTGDSIRAVVAASDKAYGDNGGEVYSEDTPLRPRGVYEISKACADMVARGYNCDWLEVMTTRCGNLYGQGDLNWSRLVPNSIRRCTSGAPPEVHTGAWKYKREWVYVQDACHAYEMIATWGQGGQAYNVGSGVIMTAGDMAVTIANKLGAPMPVLGSALPCGEIPEQALDWSRLKALGWMPQVGLDEGLRDTIKWYARYLRWA